VFRRKNGKRRKIWAKNWLLDRDKFTHINLLNYIRNDSPEDYKKYFRMSDENLKYLLAKVKPLIVKQDTVIWNAVTPEARLTATLRFLATERWFEDLKFSTIISPQALGKIILETCEAESSEWEYNSTWQFQISSKQKIAKGSSWWKKIATVNCKL
jgi:hypothetical protein